MKSVYTHTFKKGFKQLPNEVKSQAKKQIIFLLKNSGHPSLRTKKIQGTTKIWEARVSKGYRFTFQKQGNMLILRKIKKHNHTLKRP